MLTSAPVAPLIQRAASAGGTTPPNSTASGASDAASVRRAGSAEPCPKNRSRAFGCFSSTIDIARTNTSEPCHSDIVPV